MSRSSSRAKRGVVRAKRIRKAARSLQEDIDLARGELEGLTETEVKLEEDVRAAETLLAELEAKIVSIRKGSRNLHQALSLADVFEEWADHAIEVATIDLDCQVLRVCAAVQETNTAAAETTLDTYTQLLHTTETTLSGIEADLRELGNPTTPREYLRALRDKATSLRALLRTLRSPLT